MSTKTICDARSVEDQWTADDRHITLPRPNHQGENRIASWNVNAARKKPSAYADYEGTSPSVTLDLCEECFAKQIEIWLDGGAKAKWPLVVTVTRLTERQK